MYYKFTDDCRIGIPQIDKEHEHLIDIMNDLQYLLAHADTPNMREKAKRILDELKAYTISHFAAEEAYMEQIHDPELKRQKSAHNAFIERINQFDITKFSDSALKYALIDLSEYLSRWLFQHILGSDIMIGQFSSPFAFTNDYLTGIELIDTEHKKLFSIISNANDLIHAELLHDKFDEIIHIITELKEYTLEHFGDEEAYMEKISYPGLDAQKHAHAAFIQKLNEIDLDDLDDNQQAYLEDLISFLLNWLIVHIQKMDKKIGEYHN